MSRNLGIRELTDILDYYHIKKPNTIYHIKKKVNKVIVKRLCASNCDDEQKYKKLMYLLHKKRILSNQKKVKYEKTRKRIHYLLNQTRVLSPIYYLDA
jgi:hypothetical protein